MNLFRGDIDMGSSCWCTGYPCFGAIVIVVFESFGIVPPGLRFGGPYPVAKSHRLESLTPLGFGCLFEIVAMQF